MKNLLTLSIVILVCMILTGIGNYQVKPNNEFDAMEKRMHQYLMLNAREMNFIQNINYTLDRVTTTRRHDLEALKNPLAGRTRDGTPFIEQYFQRALPHSKFTPSDKISTSFYIVRKAKNQKNPANAIRLLVHFYEYRDRAYVAAVSHVDTSSSPVGKPGFPAKAFSGMPLGESCWSSAPKGSKKTTISSNARLSLHDGRFCITLDIIYFPSSYDKAGYALFEPIPEQDLKVGEYLARMALSKAYMAFYDFNKLQKINLQLGNAKVSAVKINEKLTLTPVKSVFNSLGWKMTEDYGVFKLTHRDKTITLPVGARKITIGKQQITTPLPIIYDGKEIWVEKNSLQKTYDSVK